MAARPIGLTSNTSGMMYSSVGSLAKAGAALAIRANTTRNAINFLLMVKSSS